MCFVTLRRCVLVHVAALVAGLLLAGAIADAALAAWQLPVAGGVTRVFDLRADPFEAGRHRGVDLGAAPGTPVHAACAGRVVVAGRVGTSGRVVTLLCGRWRVTHMPLASIAVARGAAVARGTVLGTVAGSRAHAGLHVGVRADHHRVGYADPLRFLRAARPTSPTPIGRRGPRPSIGPRLRPPAARRLAPAQRPLAAPRYAGSRRRPVAAYRYAGLRPRPAAAAAPAGSNPSRRGDLAPWPAWAGLALVLAGAGVRWRGRVQTRRAPVPGGLRRKVR